MFRSIVAFFLLIPSMSLLWAAPDGENLYQNHCSVCHNQQGIGGIGLPLTGTKMRDFTPEYLFKSIRHGRPGRVMPAFEKLSDAQVTAIVDHILSWPEVPEKAPVFTLAGELGDAARGAELYQHNCADCHGEQGYSDGSGTGKTLSRKRKYDVIPPALNNPGFLASANNDWLANTIHHGRPGSIMPSASELGLSANDISDLVAHLRSYTDKPLQDEPGNEIEEAAAWVFDSDDDFDTTVDNLKQALQGRNFRYFPDRWLEEGLASPEQVNQKQKTLRFCNFSQLFEMLSIDPRIGAVLPCRITIVENADGSVQLIAMNMRLVAKLFNNQQLERFAESMQEAILDVIEEATL